MKKYAAIIMLLSGTHVFSDEDKKDPLLVVIKNNAGSYNFCMEINPFCAEKVDISKYYGQEGKLTSLKPVKSDSYYDVFEVKMSNGDVLYYHKSPNTPFTLEDGIIKYSEYNAIQDSINKPIVNNSPVKIYSIEIGDTYKLSTGNEFRDNDISIVNLKNILKTIPPAKHEDFIKNVAQFKIEYDKIDEIYFIKFDGFYNLDEKDKPPIKIYVGLKNKKAWLRMRMYYGADDWLFVNSVLIKVDNFKQKYSDLDFERDNGSGEIWEWHDRPATKIEINLIQKIISSNEATVRFSGRQYYGDREINQTQKELLKSMLRVYEILNSNKINK